MAPCSSLKVRPDLLDSWVATDSRVPRNSPVPTDSAVPKVLSDSIVSEGAAEA